MPIEYCTSPFAASGLLAVRPPRCTGMETAGNGLAPPTRAQLLASYHLPARRSLAMAGDFSPLQCPTRALAWHRRSSEQRRNGSWPMAAAVSRSSTTTSRVTARGARCTPGTEGLASVRHCQAAAARSGASYAQRSRHVSQVHFRCAGRHWPRLVPPPFCESNPSDGFSQSSGLVAAQFFCGTGARTRLLWAYRVYTVLVVYRGTGHRQAAPTKNHTKGRAPRRAAPPERSAWPLRPAAGRCALRRPCCACAVAALRVLWGTTVHVIDLVS
jgi:hypothetical protein